MFGSISAFGQSSGNPFGSQSAFGQTNNPASNPFSPNPFGSQNAFGSQTGSSIFGCTSTGIFGATQYSSPFSSTPAFDMPSTPAFGASTTTTFGSSSSSFGGSSVFGQKPAFGGFGSPTPSSPFGSNFQQSQPSFGSNLFGSSTPFGSNSTSPSFGSSSTPAFGSTSTPAFGTTIPGFGANMTPTFGASTTPAFGLSNSTFGSTGIGFGASANPFGSGGGFGASSTPTFGSSSTPAFGASIAPSFGATSSPSFGSSSIPAFGTSSTAAFGVASTPTFGSSSTPFFSFGSSTINLTSPFGSSPLGSRSSPFGQQSSAFGSQATTPTFGSSGFGQSLFGAQCGGSRIAPYTPSPEVDVAAGQTPGNLESICSTPVYKDKSHEELRWEDYQLGDKGGPNPAGQPSSAIGFGVSSVQSNPFPSSSTFGQSSSSPFSTPLSNLFGANLSPFGSIGFGTSTSGLGSSGFGTMNTPNPFGTSATATSSLFSTPSTTFGCNTSIFGTTTAAFGSSSLFGSAQPQGNTSFNSGLNFLNTSSPPFQSITPSIGQTSGAFGQTGLSFGPTSTSSFGQSSLFSTPSFGGGNLFSSSMPFPTGAFGQTTPSLSTPFPAAQSTQTSSAFSFGNFNQIQTGMGDFGTGSSIFGQIAGQLSATPSFAVVQPATVTSPFGVLPAMPQISIGLAGTSPSVQYGISSMPVVDKLAPVRISSLLTSRHFSQSRIKLPARKYHPKSDSQKVAFFSDDEKILNMPKADAVFIPRENPRAFFIQPMDQWPSKANIEKSSPLEDITSSLHENESIAEDELDKDQQNATKAKTSQNQNSNGEDSYIEAMMPKLGHSDYYTEPRIQELAAKERAEPGSCCSVKNFVVGRHGYGSVRFLGETDLRRLDLESIIQFNNREVIVYMDDSKKPPIGQGLNKPAEVTLLNIKCFNKKTGEYFTQGPKTEKYKEMLRRKAEDQGAEFLSYDPIKGEWKFKVDHFSSYRLDQEDDEEKDEIVAVL